jgi:hypothetical protein
VIVTDDVMLLEIAVTAETVVIVGVKDPLRVAAIDLPHLVAETFRHARMTEMTVDETVMETIDADLEARLSANANVIGTQEMTATDEMMTVTPLPTETTGKV